MSTNAVPMADSGHALSEPERIINTFIAPSKTFADIRRKASWWVPWLLSAIVGLGFGFAVQRQIGWEQVANNLVHATPKAADRYESATPEQQAQQLRVTISMTKFFTYAGPVLGLVFAAIVSGVLFATFRFAAGAQMTFGQAMAVVFYSWLPFTIYYLLGILTLFVGANPEGFNIQNPVATNFGALLNQGDSPALYALASSIDIFTIWTVFLLALGFSIVGKVKRGTAMAVVIGWWVIWVLIKVGGAAMQS